MNGLTYYLISTVAGHDKAHKAHQAANLIEQQQAEINALKAEQVEVARKAYLDGFMASAVSYNGEFYQYGYKVVVDGFNEDIEQYTNKIKAGDL